MDKSLNSKLKETREKVFDILKESDLDNFWKIWVANSAAMEIAREEKKKAEEDAK